MIRNVCIHVSNEQPLLCDLYALPSSTDAGLVCTNVRSMDGKRPIFVDQTTSTFFFPYHVVRFLEIPQAEMAAYAASGRGLPFAQVGGPDDGGELDPASAMRDEPFRTTAEARESLLPVAVGAPTPAGAEDGDLELEIDEDFLQRIRDI